MTNWTGAAGLCLDRENRLLMILQGPPEEEKKWSVPAAVVFGGESLEEALMEELREVTGCSAVIAEEVTMRKMQNADVGLHVDMHYFAAELKGIPEAPKEDELIAEIAYKTADELESLALLYPEERELLIAYMKR